MRIVNPKDRCIDYRLNLLGIRIWEDGCQLIAKRDDGWTTIGPGWDLPIIVPISASEVNAASGLTLHLTAYQYDMEHPGSDLRAILSREKDFDAALAANGAAAGSDVSN